MTKLFVIALGVFLLLEFAQVLRFIVLLVFLLFRTCWKFS